ncbi:MAG: TRAP transporter substrate-binding protein DctP [Kofleriaceae bacterium]
MNTAQSSSSLHAPLVRGRVPRKLVGVAALALGLGALAPVAVADTAELRLATIAPSESDWGKVLAKGGAEITSATGGRVKINYYMDGTQGGENDYVKKMKSGALDGAGLTAVGLSQIEESIRVLELPMMFDSIDELDYVADKMWSSFQAKFEKKGFKLNDRGDVGWIHVLSKSKVDSMASMRGLKLWQYGADSVYGPLYKKLGLSGVSLDIGEVDSALGSGRINACYGSPLAATALQWASKVKFMMKQPINFAISATVIRADALTKISADDQKAMAKVAKSMGKKLRKIIRKRNEDSKKTMTRMGVQIVDTPAAMVDELRKSAEALWTELVGKVYSQKDLDTVLKHRAAYRAKHPK